MSGTILLKKYSNRRLYDTDKSRYVTLDQVADMVRSGKRVEIVDAKTSEDVTAFILTQILMEEAKRKNVLMPPPVLHLIIRYGDNVLTEFMHTYLQRAIQNYISYKQAFDEQVQKWIDMGTDMSQMMSSSMANSPFSKMMDMFSVESRTVGSKVQNDSSEKASDDSEPTDTNDNT